MTFYNQIASSFDHDTYNLYAHTHQIALKQIQRNMESADSVLDLCVGTGNFALKLYQAIDLKNFTGIDISEKMLDVAKGKLPFPWVPVKSCASGALDHFEEESQDLILSHFLYDYISPEILLPLCFRLLKPGGWLSIITTTKQQYDTDFYQEIDKSKILSSFLKVRDNIKKANHPHSHADHKALLEKNDFVIKESDELLMPLLVKNGKEIWNLLYDSGWMVRPLSSYSPVTLKILKNGVRMLQMPPFNVYPLKFKFHSSLMLVQKR